MTRTFRLLALLLIGSAAGATAAPPAGFVPLFNGRDLTGWKEGGLPHWRVEGDELVNDEFGDSAVTRQDYGDFELLFDRKTEAKADSGIDLRGVPLVLADRPFGEWNHFRILMIGSRVSVWLNERLVVDHAILERRSPAPPRGPIQLQTHGGAIRWRNLDLREIGSEEACRILASHGTAGLQRIFNGTNLDGWAGDLTEVKIANGALVWQPGQDGNLYWNRTLGDFRARVEFKLPPGGNNGLAIRYPGTGKPAYSGMCEIQVLDDNYEKVKGKIDPRQAHGSAYGMVAAARGYQHPITEWNFQEVTVRGSTIRVELNGTVILDTDLSRVNLGAAAKTHPGKDRRTGFFGFAGHEDPVGFRNILIQEL